MTWKTWYVVSPLVVTAIPLVLVKPTDWPVLPAWVSKSASKYLGKLSLGEAYHMGFQMLCGDLVVSVSHRMVGMVTAQGGHIHPQCLHHLYASFLNVISRTSLVRPLGHPNVAGVAIPMAQLDVI